jgi:hypothetical protein
VHPADYESRSAGCSFHPAAKGVTRGPESYLGDESESAMHTSLMKLLKNAIHSNMITLGELQELEADIQWAIMAKKQEQVAHSPLNREGFIQAIVRHGQAQRLPASAEHLRAAAEYLYDSEVLGMSPDDILRANRPRAVHAT